jgi:hypothetical protein
LLPGRRVLSPIFRRREIGNIAIIP